MWSNSWFPSALHFSYLNLYCGKGRTEPRIYYPHHPISLTKRQRSHGSWDIKSCKNSVIFILILLLSLQKPINETKESCNHILPRPLPSVDGRSEVKGFDPFHSPVLSASLLSLPFPSFVPSVLFQSLQCERPKRANWSEWRRNGGGTTEWQRKDDHYKEIINILLSLPYGHPSTSASFASSLHSSLTH